MAGRLKYSLAAFVFTVSLTSVSHAADEVRWRYDYTAARRESQQTGRPMLLDFSTDWCAPCRRLEKTTFRDPTVVQLLNEQFIPVKLDGSKEKALVDLLKVQAYPTLILASADGQIVKNIEGFVEAKPLREHLQEVVTGTAEAKKQTNADRSEAVQSTQRKRASALLALAKSDYEQKSYLSCMERCTLVVQEHGTSPEASEARHILDHLKSNPQWMRAACAQLAVRLSEMHLALAENHMSKEETKAAVEQLERVLAVAPASPNAEQARAQLARLRTSASPATLQK